MKEKKTPSLLRINPSKQRGNAIFPTIIHCKGLRKPSYTLKNLTYVRNQSEQGGVSIAYLTTPIMEISVKSLKKTARIAGLLYLVWTITAMYSLVYVQSKTMVKGNGAATADKILNNEFIFRTGIVNSIASSAVWVLIGLTLYQLFRHVNERQAKLLVALVIVQVPVVFFTEAVSLTILMLVKGDILQTFSLNQKHDLAMFLFGLNNHATIALEMFWGLWLFPFGILVYKSGFIPRILGIFLIANGIAYVIHFLTHILFPNYADLVFKISTPIWILGEISIMLWLLIKGVKSHIPSIERPIAA